MFTRLDDNGEFFGLTPLIPPMIWDINRTYHLPIPSSFPNFVSAQRSWDFLMDEALQFYRRTFFNQEFAPASSDPPDKIEKQYEYYIQQLSIFERAFQPILDKSVGGDGTVYNPAALVLTLYQKSVVLILATVRNPSELIYDSYLPEFQYITNTCSRLLRAEGLTGTSKNKRFSFEVGIIPPLHFTATKCRDPIIRREAIDLLFSYPRQEGMWDSILCGRIGTWIASCEEDGLPSPPIAPQQANLYVSPSEDETGGDELFKHSRPQSVQDRTAILGGFEEGTRLADVISHLVGDNFIDSVSDEADTTMTGPTVSSTRNRRPMFLKGWRVPEKNRVELTVLEFHIPERYIKFRCRRTLLSEDGSREVRDVVMGW
jgi:hypothetical protein